MIEQYLAAYYDGTATEQEEQALAGFFSDEANVPERWKEEREIFLLLRESAAIRLPDGFENRLEKRLDAHIAGRKPFTLRRTVYKIAGVAAAILLCISIGINQGVFTSKPVVMADTYSDPHEAAKAAGEALLLLSTNLNKGLDQVSEAEEEIRQVNEIINNQLK